MDENIVECTMYIPIRKSYHAGLDESYEWIDTESGSFDLDLCKRHVADVEASIPDWCKENPLARISLFSLTEIKKVE